MARRTWLICGASALAAGSMGLTGQAFAQAPGAATLEEVVVTARKREESLQQVPVAVSAATGEQLEQQGIRQPTDLTRTVPSLQIASTNGTGASGAVITLRGQSMGDVLLTLSPAVGLYLDSVNVPHPMGANVSFYDLQRVEVLKGAQGTLYGRNTTGGAVNIITRGADHNGLHGFAEGEYGNYDSIKATLGLNLPVVQDILAVRLAYQHWERDGYGRSLVTGQKQGGDRDDDAVRASVRFDPTETFTAVLKLEYAQAKRAGQLFTVRDFVRSAAALANTSLNEERFYTGVAGGVAPFNLTTCTNDRIFESCTGTVGRDDTKTKHAALDLNWDVTDNIRLRSVTGYHWFENFRIFDLDATPYMVAENGGQFDVGVARPPPGARLPDGTLAPPPPYVRPFALRPDQTSKQWTQELNLSGVALDNRFNWLLGAFYSFDQGRGAQMSVRQPATLTATGPASVPANLRFFAPTVQAFEGKHLNVTTMALFTQNDFRFSDVVSLTLGVRYTAERMKQLNGAWIFNPNFEHAGNATAAGVPLSGPGQNFQCLTGPFVGTPQVGLVGGPDYQTTEFNCAINQSTRFNGISYLASLNLQFTPEILTYFRIARGFKGGALQWRAPTEPTVRPEIAEDYEIGFKGDFFNRRLRTNLALFHTNFTDQQLSTIVFLPGTNVRTTVLQNAADVRMRGAELEFRVLPPIEGLSVYGNVGYLDAQYQTFNNALVTGGLIADRSGEYLDVPKWTGNLGARYEFDVGPGRLGLQADAAYRGRRPLTRTNLLNPLTRGLLNPAIPDQAGVIDTLKEFREPYALVNARIDYDLPDLGVNVALWATNLLDREYQAPSLDWSANFGLLTGITQEPRMYGVTVRKTFGDE